MQLLRREGRLHRLQGGLAPPALRVGAWEDPAATRDRHLRQAPAAADRGAQAGALDRAAPLYSRPALTSRRTNRMTFSPQLRIPGPTPLPEPVVRAQSQPMIDHRGPEFAALLREVTEGARRVFGTSHDLLVLTCSGTGGMESAVANLVSPGDVAVVAACGHFGERRVGILRAH